MKKSKATRRAIQVINSHLDDPPGRKKTRDEHPMNRILHCRLELLKKPTLNNVVTIPTLLSDMESETEDKLEVEPVVKMSTKSEQVDLDLSIPSDSYTSTKEGKICETTSNEVIIESKFIDNKAQSSSSMSDKGRVSSVESALDEPKPSTSTANVITSINQTQGENYLEANEIHEYVPQPLEKAQNSTLEHTPTQIPGNPRLTNSMIPKKEIMFHMWDMIRKIDQEVGRDLEYSLIKHGFLKPRFTNH